MRGRVDLCLASAEQAPHSIPCQISRMQGGFRSLFKWGGELKLIRPFNQQVRGIPSTFHHHTSSLARRITQLLNQATDAVIFMAKPALALLSTVRAQ
jgi:hypothetical protein